MMLSESGRPTEEKQSSSDDDELAAGMTRQDLDHGLLLSCSRPHCSAAHTQLHTGSEYVGRFAK